mgnify:FL=1
MIEWELGATYRIAPKSKKQIVMKKIYYKSDDYDQKIIHDETYRNGWVELEIDGVEADSEHMNNYLGDTYDSKEGVDVWYFELTDHEIVDGVADQFSFSDNVSEEEKEKLSTLIHENGVQIIEEIGWEFEDTEVWFFGELEITKK